jgi:hypothetical protein
MDLKMSWTQRIAILMGNKYGHDEKPLEAGSFLFV